MPYGNVSGKITEEDKKFTGEKAAEIERRFPFIINLSPKERKSLPTIAEGREAAVRRILELAEINTRHLPGSVDLKEARADYELTVALGAVMLPLRQLLEKLSDTRIAAGSEAFRAIRLIRKHLRAAAEGNPGLDDVVGQIDDLFKQSGAPDIPADTGGDASGEGETPQ